MKNLRSKSGSRISDWQQTTRTDPWLGRQIEYFHHVSGFRLALIHHPGFARKHAAIGVRLGSNIRSYQRQDQHIEVLPGAAHFIEHCIFDQDEAGGLLGRLAALGASANAYTSAGHTMYYFSTFNHFLPCLELYLEAVSRPTLSDARIAAERTIIQAEIDQYQDDPDSRMTEQLLRNLYQHHPVREDIAGTHETVAQMSAARLQTLHRDWYHPARLQLTVSGDFSAGEAREALLRMLDTWLHRYGAVAGSAPELTVRLATEPQDVVRAQDVLRMDVPASAFLVGFKFTGPDRTDPLQMLRQSLALSLTADLWLSPASADYDLLYRRGLINQSFSYRLAVMPDYAYLICGGESDQGELAAQEVAQLFQRALTTPVQGAPFRRQQRSSIGDLIRIFDSVSHSCMAEASAGLDGVCLFDIWLNYDKINEHSFMELWANEIKTCAVSSVILCPDGGH